MRKILNSQGFSLVEILVGVGMVGGLSLGLAQMMKNSNEGQTQIMAKDDLRSSSQKISSILSNPEACVNTFSPVLATPANITQAETATGSSFLQIRSRENTVSVSVGEKLGKVTYTSFILKNLRRTAFTADLVINASFNKSATIKLERAAVIPISMTIDPVTNQITSCSASFNDSDIWSKMTLPEMGIYYSSGSVKIGSGVVDSGSSVPSMIMGTNNTAQGENSLAIGESNEVTNDLSMALGYKNQLTGARSYAIGGYNRINLATEVPLMTAMAFGTSNWVSANNAFAIGTMLSVASEGSLALGFNSTTTDTAIAGRNSIVIGTASSSTNISSVAIGTAANAVAENGVAIGTGSNAIDTDALAMGSDAMAAGKGSVANGFNSRALLDNSVAIGANANSTGLNAISIGLDANARENSVVIGRSAQNNGRGAVVIGSAGSMYQNGTAFTTTKTFASGDGSVVIGSGATDAKAVPNLANATYYNTGDDGLFGAGYAPQHVVAIGTNARASNIGTVALGINALAAGAESMALGPDASALGRGSVSIGVSDGGRITAFGHNSLALGTKAVSSNGKVSAAIGYHLNAKNNSSMILGMNVAGNVAETQADGELHLTAVNSIRLCVGTNGTPASYASNCLVMGAPGSPALGGGWSWASDKNLKKDITKLDSQEVLEKITQMDMSTWLYKNQKNTDKKNIGPMAQDFHRLFVVPYRLNGNDKTISPNDVFNFGLIGIQALAENLKKVEEENEALKKEQKEMKAVLCELKPQATFCKR